jgi:hypothetical protein
MAMIATAGTGARVVSATTKDQNHDDNEPQAGTIIVSGVKAHVFHPFFKT